MPQQEQDAVKQVEQIIEGGPKYSIHSIAIPSFAARHIYELLAVSAAWEHGAHKIWQFPVTNPEMSSHPESLVGLLLSGLEKALAAIPEEEDELGKTVAIDVTSGAVDLINKGFSLNTQPPPYVELGSLEEKEAYFRTLTIHIATFLSLNRAFVQAGGIPPPAFLDYYEGSIPPTTQDKS